jgi:Zn-dependent protease with chaperone function
LVAQRTITAYTLTPEQFRKSEALHRTTLVLSLGSTVFGLAVLTTLIAVRFGPKLQRVVESFTRRRLLQALMLVPAVLLTLSILNLPFAVYAHHVARDYGLSVQGWAPWMADWLKAEFLIVLFASLVLWGLYTGLRRAPRHCWFYAWLVSLPIMAAMVFASPVLIDPLFNRFEPLAKTAPLLTTQLRGLALTAGLDIPESRIFLMHASDKVTTYNAYVTGFGATRRIVVWDTTVHDLTVPQTLFVFGHEMGHYVLHHILLGLAFTTVMTLAGFWLTQRLAEALLVRFGQRWQIRTLSDWSSLPLLLLLFSTLAFLSMPLDNGFSRWEEHQADAYSLALNAKLATDPAQPAAQAFQLLGEKSFSYPDPSPLQVFWFYSHPPISQRIRFVLSYGQPSQPAPAATQSR